MAEWKGVRSSSPARTPKFKLTAEQPSKIYEKKISCTHSKTKKWQQDGRRHNNDKIKLHNQQIGNPQTGK